MTRRSLALLAKSSTETQAMSICKIFCGGCLAMVAFTAAATPATAARACIFDWAVPGPYEISGNFRGQVETVTAQLTNDCRVMIGFPGVATGGALSRAGSCLAFSFRVEGEQDTLEARWCGSHGVVPWQGRDVRATIVRRESPSAPESR